MGQLGARVLPCTGLAGAGCGAASESRALSGGTHRETIRSAPAGRQPTGGRSRWAWRAQTPSAPLFRVPGPSHSVLAVATTLAA